LQRYLAITFEAGGRQLQEMLVADAWQAGTLGCAVDSTSESRITVFFDSVPAARDFCPHGQVTEISRHWVEDEDWLRGYRDSVEPIEVGAAWVVDARDPSNDDLRATLESGGCPDARTPIRVPARRAFGTGGHESTRLALRLLEQTPTMGRRSLDFGYGSGVLSFAVASAGAEFCLGLERDLVAGLVGAQNRILNRHCGKPRFALGTATALTDEPWVDLLLINVRPDHWLPHRGSLQACLKPSGAVICSGFLAHEMAFMESYFDSLAWRVIDSANENEWMAVTLGVEL